MKNFSKQLIKQLFKSFGLEVRLQPSNEQKNTIPRTSFQGCLQNGIENGLNPQTVIDVGVATGTPELYKAFPDAFHLLIEPLRENLPYLEQWQKELKHCEYRLAVASNQVGETLINVHSDLVGSSLYKETEGASVDGNERTVRAVTLDTVCKNLNLSEPYLIKIDTQGSEIDVLEGATHILPKTQFVILEVSFFEFFQGAPTTWDYFEFMKQRSFVIYDIFDISYRLLDGAMSQVNMAFVQKDSIFRQVHSYASPEQRQAQNERILNQEYSP